MRSEKASGYPHARGRRARIETTPAVPTPVTKKIPTATSATVSRTTPTAVIASPGVVLAPGQSAAGRVAAGVVSGASTGPAGSSPGAPLGSAERMPGESWSAWAPAPFCAGVGGVFAGCSASDWLGADPPEGVCGGSGDATVGSSGVTVAGRGLAGPNLLFWLAFSNGLVVLPRKVLVPVADCGPRPAGVFGPLVDERPGDDDESELGLSADAAAAVVIIATPNHTARSSDARTFTCARDAPTQMRLRALKAAVELRPWRSSCRRN